jgi:DNA-binding response OmpR family regulator
MSQELDGKKVLLVDDDSDILSSMQAAFEPTGAVVETASNGNKAVEIAERTQPDLVILDMMLPGRSGFLVLEKIKARKPKNAKPFVIMITGNQGGRHKMYAESLGVSEYFNKPVKLDKLIASADQHARSSPFEYGRIKHARPRIVGASPLPADTQPIAPGRGLSSRRGRRPRLRRSRRDSRDACGRSETAGGHRVA